MGCWVGGRGGGVWGIGGVGTWGVGVWGFGVCGCGVWGGSARERGWINVWLFGCLRGWRGALVWVGDVVLNCVVQLHH